MPKWIKPKEEKSWEHALDIVKKEKDKPKSKFKDKDWGLTMHIFKNIQKSKSKKKKKAEFLYMLLKIANAMDTYGCFSDADMVDEIIANNCLE